MKTVEPLQSPTGDESVYIPLKTVRDDFWTKFAAWIDYLITRVLAGKNS